MPDERLPNYEEIESELALLRKEIDKDADRDLPIPDFLYHVTDRKNLRSILQEGLHPSPLLDPRRDPAVSLSDDIEFAKEVVSITQGIRGRSIIILKIDTRFLSTHRTINYLRKADPENPNITLAAAIHEVHYEGDIPPEAIEVVKEHDRNK